MNNLPKITSEITIIGPKEDIDRLLNQIKVDRPFFDYTDTNIPSLTKEVSTHLYFITNEAEIYADVSSFGMLDKVLGDLSNSIKELDITLFAYSAEDNFIAEYAWCNGVQIRKEERGFTRLDYITVLKLTPDEADKQWDEKFNIEPVGC